MITFPEKQFMQFRNIKETSYHRTHAQNSEMQQYQYQPQPMQPQIYHQPRFQQPRLPQQKPHEPLRNNPNHGFGMASMEQLNQDLNRLKSQLQRLSEQEKEEELKRTSSNRQQLYDPKVRARSNLSADNSMNRGRQQSQRSFRSPFETANIKFITPAPQNNQPSLTKSNGAIKVVPIINPNKIQRERKVYPPGESSPGRVDNERADKGQNVDVSGKGEQQLQRILKQNKQLKEELENARLDIAQLKAKFQEEREKSKAEIDTLSKSMNQKFEQDRIKYQTVLRKLQEDLVRTKQEQQLIQPPSFDEALKKHLEQQQKLTRLLQQRTQKVASLQEQVSEQARQIDRLKGELNLRDMKSGGELRAKIQRQEIQLKQISNELQSTLRNLETVQHRYKAATKEIQQKDEFILKNFVGRVSDKQLQDIRQKLDIYKEALNRQNSLFSIITDPSNQRLQ